MRPLSPHLIHLFIAVSFTQFIMFVYEEKNYKAFQKQKPQFEKAEQASEPDTAEILRLSDGNLRQL